MSQHRIVLTILGSILTLFGVGTALVGGAIATVILAAVAVSGSLAMEEPPPPYEMHDRQH